MHLKSLPTAKLARGSQCDCLACDLKIDRRRPDILVLDDALDEGQRESILQTIAGASFEEQQLGPLVMGRARERAVLENDLLAEVLWSMLCDHIGPVSDWFPAAASTSSRRMSDWTAIGCNPRSRLYRYGMGGDFSLHYDEPWKPKPYVRSLLTVLLYLPTDGCVGGETVIDGQVVQVAPWRIAVFDHCLQHEGKPVERGEKLVLRNDVVARLNQPKVTGFASHSE